MPRLHIFAAAAAAAAFVAGGAAAQTVGFGTGPQGTLTNTMGSAIASVASEAFDLRTRSVPHTSTDLHLPLVNRGAIEFGVAGIQAVAAGVKAEEQFEGRELPNLRVAARLVPFPIAMKVRADSDIRSISDVRGKRFPMGYTAQPTVIGIVNGMLANGGVAPDEVDPVQVPNTTRGNELFMEGRVDAVVGSLGGARLRQVDARVGGIRLLPFDTSDEAVKRMQAEFPHAYLLELQPDEGSIGFDEPIHTFAYDFLLAVGKDVSDEIVYQVVKAMHGNKEGMVAIARVFDRFQPDEMAGEYDDIEFHPGAVKFYREIGIWPTS